MKYKRFLHSFVTVLGLASIAFCQAQAAPTADDQAAKTPDLVGDLGATFAGLGYYGHCARRVAVLKIDLAKLDKIVKTYYKATGKTWDPTQYKDPNRWFIVSTHNPKQKVVANKPATAEDLPTLDPGKDARVTWREAGTPSVVNSGGSTDSLLVPLNFVGDVNDRGQMYKPNGSKDTYEDPDFLDGYMIGFKFDDKASQIIFQGAATSDVLSGKSENVVSVFSDSTSILTVTSASQKQLTTAAQQSNEYLDKVPRPNLYQVDGTLDLEHLDHTFGSPVARTIQAFFPSGNTSNLSSYWTLSSAVISSQRLDTDSRVPMDLRVEFNTKHSYGGAPPLYAELQYNSNQEYNNSQAVFALGLIYRLTDIMQKRTSSTTTLTTDVDSNFTVRLGGAYATNTATYGLGRPDFGKTLSPRGFASLTTKSFKLFSTRILPDPISVKAELDQYSLGKRLAGVPMNPSLVSLTLNIPTVGTTAVTLSYSRGYDPGSAFSAKSGGFTLGLSSSK